VGVCNGYCGTLCGYTKNCCGVGSSHVNHHHHHSHFNSNVCNSGHGVPSFCQGYNLSGQGQDLDNMQLYHRVMSNTYKAEREMKERETKWRAGVPGIPFAHKTSIQGNPMRSGDWKSSSKYHKYCTKED